MTVAPPSPAPGDRSTRDGIDRGSLRDRAATALSWVMLASLLVLGFVWGNAFAYPALIAALLGLIVWDGAAYRDVLGRPWVWALIASFLLFGLSMVANATTVRERFAFVDFVPVLLAVPASSLFLRARIRNPATVLAALALLGTATAVAVCLLRGFLTGFGRTAAWEISPIHFADLAVIAGFMALAGLMGSRSRFRWVFWLGPVLGLAASILAGTRGSLVVAAALLPLAAVYLLRARVFRAATLAAILAGIVVLVSVAGVAAVALGLGRTFEATAIIEDILAGRTVTDMSVWFRLDMYQGALRAIPSEPLFGYGWTHQLDHILPFMSAAGQDEYQREHWGYVHNEVLSFVIGLGVPGAIGCLLLFAYPLIGIATTPRDNLSSLRNYLCLTVLIGIVVSGLSDVLFMVELPKAFFCFVPAAVLLLCRQIPGAAAPPTGPNLTDIAAK